MKEIKISIIIPVYNTEKYLERCLTSIVEQSLKEIEIIIVNDGSPDNSNEIIEKFKIKDERIISINKKNSGLSAARNTGIKISKGEYILHIDSDDWIEKNYFERMYLKAKKDNLDIVISDIYFDFDNGNVRYKKDLNINENTILTNIDYINYFFGNKITPAVWNKLIKRELYVKNKILHPENVTLGEDLSTTPRLAYYAKRIGKINEAYIHYIQNPKSITNNNSIKKIYELIDAIEILENFFQNKLKIENIQSFKIYNLSEPLLSCKYDCNDFFYIRAIEYYLNLNNIFVEKKLGVKIYLYSLLLNKFNHKTTFKFIYKLNRINVKIKNKLRKSLKLNH